MTDELKPLAVSDTPRTDAAEIEFSLSAIPDYDGPHLWVESYLSRTLERELTAVRAELASLREDAKVAITAYAWADYGTEELPDEMRAAINRMTEKAVLLMAPKGHPILEAMIRRIFQLPAASEET